MEIMEKAEHHKAVDSQECDCDCDYLMNHETDLHSL